MAAPPPGLPGLIGIAQNILTLAFWVLVAADHAGRVSIIDPEYKEHGFCVASSPIHPFNSYQLCFILDTAACVVLLSLRNAASYYGYACSLFFHGAFHMAQYIFGWPFPPWVELVTYPVFALAFLGGFGIGSRVGTKLHLVVAVVAVELFRRAFVPDVLVFAYTNTWIYATAAVVAVASPDTSAPRLLPALIFLAGVVVPFCEAILCNHGFKDLGGHALFDLTIAVGTLVDATTRGNKGKQH